MSSFVERVPLGSLVRICNGGDYKSFGPGDVPVYGTGGIMTYVDRASYRGPSVLIPRKGSLNKLYYVDRPFWTVDTIFYTEIGPRVRPKYLYYWLANKHLERLNEAAGVPSLTKRQLNRILVDVPDLARQNEIVQILDSFTSLEAELEAELEARRDQYAFYRDQLLTFNSSVERLPLNKFAVLDRGHGLQKSDFSDSGVDAIHYGQIYTRYGTYSARAISKVSPVLASQLVQVHPGDVVVTNTSENIEDVGKALAWLGSDNAVTGGHATVIRHDQNPKYLAYWFQTTDFFTQKKKYAYGTKVIELPARLLGRIEIPLPSREEQDRIVSILDKFEAYTTSLTDGLPAEIEARRQQYEYYRDRLLSFSEANA